MTHFDHAVGHRNLLDIDHIVECFFADLNDCRSNLNTRDDAVGRKRVCRDFFYALGNNDVAADTQIFLKNAVFIDNEGVDLDHCIFFGKTCPSFLVKIESLFGNYKFTAFGKIFKNVGAEGSGNSVHYLNLIELLAA